MLQEVRWSCINGEGQSGGSTEGGGRRVAEGRVLTELINELALRDKA